MNNPYKHVPDWESVYGGKFFSPADLHEGPVTAKIIAVEYDDTLFCKGVGKNARIVLTLQGQQKKIVVNKTSAKALAFKYSKDFNAWIGKTIMATGGEVNGKAAVLLKEAGSAPRSTATPTAALPPAPSATSAGSGNGTDQLTATGENLRMTAWGIVSQRYGMDAKEEWTKFMAAHKKDYQAIIDACAVSEDLHLDEGVIPDA